MMKRQQEQERKGGVQAGRCLPRSRLLSPLFRRMADVRSAPEEKVVVPASSFKKLFEAIYLEKDNRRFVRKLRNEIEQKITISLEGLNHERDHNYRS
jgi:hypothetical protein